MPRFSFRSAVTGRWVTRLFALLNPRETVMERTEIARIAACPFGVHEALHTAHVLADTFHDHVREHPVVSERPELAALADKAVDAMLDVYQAIGGLPERIK